MSPEQLARSRRRQGDQFSYCVAVHEALFGARPFAGDTLDELARGSGAVPRDRRTARRAEGRCAASRWARRSAALASMTLVDGRRAARRPRQRRIAALVGGAIAAAVAIAVVVAREPDPYDTVQIATEARIAAAWNPGRAAVLRARFLATGTPLAAERAATTARLLDAYRAGWTTQRLDAWSATQLRGERTPEISTPPRVLRQLADAMDRLVGLF